MRGCDVVLSGDSCCYAKRYARLDQYTYIYYNLHCVVVYVDANMLMTSLLACPCHYCRTCIALVFLHAQPQLALAWVVSWCTTSVRSAALRCAGSGSALTPPGRRACVIIIKIILDLITALVQLSSVIDWWKLICTLIVSAHLRKTHNTAY